VVAISLGRGFGPEECENLTGYLVITPARNEEDMLPGLSNCIVNQLVQPVLWVIGDDWSSDKTWFIIRNLANEFPWIKGVRLGSRREREYAHRRYAEIVDKAFKFAVARCRRQNLKYDFLAIVDADVRIEHRYFEKLIRAFHTNSRLGIASGLVYEKGMSLMEVRKSNAEPRGCALVFRRECYEMIGGFHGHTNSIVKAQSRNWQVEVLPWARAFHRRKSRSRKDYFLTAGMSSYSLNYHPINAFLRGIYYFVRASPSDGLHYIAGYIKSLIIREKKIEDEDIREYYWNSFNRLLGRILKSVGVRFES
jgi:glycosyltransferase involved in cell wall biosynthesis